MARAKRKQYHSTHQSASGVSAGRKQIRRMQKGAPSAFDVFSGPMARIMDQNFSLFQKAFQTMQEESLRFFNRRLEHTSHAIEHSRDFQSVSGLMQMQREWMLDFARDCSEQATRFSQLMRDMALDSTERLAEASFEGLKEGEREIEDEEEEYEGEEEEHRAAA